MTALGSTLTLWLWMCGAGWQDSETVRSLLEARLLRLQHVVVEYRQAEETLIALGDKTEVNGVSVTFDDAFREKICRLTMLGGDVLYDVRIADSCLDAVRSGEIAEPVHAVRLLTRERDEKLIQPAPGREYYGNVRDPSTLPTSLVMHQALGIALANREVVWITQGLLASAGLATSSSGDVEVEWVDPSDSKHRWLFARDAGMALARYSVLPRNAVFETLVIENADFRQVDGVLLPFRVEQRRYREIDGQRRVSHETHIDVEWYRLSTSRRDDLRIKWPPGVPVYDARTGTRCEPDGAGGLQEVHSRLTGEDGPEGTDSPVRSTNTRTSSLSGWGAVLIGVIAGGLALILSSRSSRQMTVSGTRVPSALIIGCFITGAFGYARPALCQDAASSDRLNLGDSLEKGLRDWADRRARFLVNASGIIVERLTRDLQLDAQQRANGVELFLTYLDELEVASKAFNSAMKQWKAEYWAGRIMLEENVIQFPGESATVGWKVATDVGPDGAVHYTLAPLEAVDGEYKRTSGMEYARLYREMVLAPTQAARNRMVQNIVAMLDETQLRLWNHRGYRRFEIALHDAMTPRTAGRPNPDPDMLGLLEEAALHGGELEAFASVIFAPLTFEQSANVEAERVELSSIAAIIEAFEITYLAALEGQRERWEDVFKYRAKGLEKADPEAQRVENGLRRMYRNTWGVRQGLVSNLQAAVVEAVGPEAAAQWEERFVERCSPWLFEPDRIDAIATRLETVEVAADLRETLERIIAEYETDRRQLRIRTSQATIDLRGSKPEGQADIQAQIHRLLGAREQIEDRTIAAIRAILQSRAPGVVSAVMGDPPPPADAGGNE